MWCDLTCQTLGVNKMKGVREGYRLKRPILILKAPSRWQKEVGKLLYVSYIPLLWVTCTLSTSTLNIRANFEQLLSLMSVEALKWNVCNFLPSWGICIRLSVLQSSHRPAPCFRAKSWLKVQSSIEQCDSSKISFPCHLPSYLYDYLWLNLPLVPVFTPFDRHCVKLTRQYISETADCDFKTRCVCETDESALHSAAKQMLFPSC